MDAAQRRELSPIETLRAERDAIDAGSVIFRESAALHGGGVRLQRDLGVGRARASVARERFEQRARWRAAGTGSACRRP